MFGSVKEGENGAGLVLHSLVRFKNVGFVLSVHLKADKARNGAAVLEPVAMPLIRRATGYRVQSERSPGNGAIDGYPKEGLISERGLVGSTAVAPLTGLDVLVSRTGGS